MALIGSRSTGFQILISAICMATGPPPAPTLLHCEFQEHANATCHWALGKDTPLDTTYTLQVNETMDFNGRVYSMEQCQTTGYHCSVPILTVSASYCVRVTAHSSGGTASSTCLCLHGTEAVKLYPPVFSKLSAVHGRPRCLEVRWSEPPSFALSSHDVSAGHLLFQLQYSSEEQPQPRVVDVDLRQKDQCLFFPFTLYSMRIRYRYYRALQHWSDWSSARQARTEEAPPSGAPQLWRQVGAADLRGWRFVTLLWKSLPPFLANGRILGYNVSCWQDTDLAEMNSGDCGAMHPSNMSCRLALPPQRCFCTLSATNSAGSSPTARIVIPRTSDTVLPPPEALSVIPLDDFSLRVQWTSSRVLTVTGFVLEWFAVSETVSPCLYWQSLGRNTSDVVITEGVAPEVRYAVEVRVVSEAVPGEKRAVLVYTRQGAPSAGPKLQVLALGSSSVTLRWEPVPLEQRRGFIRNYTLHCQSAAGQVTRVVLPVEKRQHLLSGLSGEYTIYLVANNDAGGKASQPITVAVGNGSLLPVTVLCCITLPVLTVLITLACLGHRERIKQSLCPKVPDPAKSSLSAWIPKTLQKQGLNKPRMQEALKPPYPVTDFNCQSDNEKLQSEQKNHSPVKVTGPRVEHILPTNNKSWPKWGLTLDYCRVTDNLSRSSSADRDLHSYNSFCGVATALPSCLATGDGNCPFWTKDSQDPAGDLSAFPLLLQFCMQDSKPPAYNTEGSNLACLQIAGENLSTL